MPNATKIATAAALHFVTRGARNLTFLAATVREQATVAVPAIANTAGFAQPNRPSTAMNVLTSAAPTAYATAHWRTTSRPAATHHIEVRRAAATGTKSPRGYPPLVRRHRVSRTSGRLWPSGPTRPAERRGRQSDR